MLIYSGGACNGSEYSCLYDPHDDLLPEENNVCSIVRQLAGGKKKGALL